MHHDVVIAALPAELAPLVRGWDRTLVAGVSVWRRGRVSAACAGMGQPAALRALSAAEAAGEAGRVISAGFAGAARPGFLPGECYVSAGALDAATEERFAAVGGRADCWVATLDRIAGPAEKRAASVDAALVDMEAAALGRIAHQRGLPFYCVKAVTDGPEESLPPFERWITTAGRLRTGAFLGHVLVRPALWPRLLRLGRVSGRAARGLKDQLALVLASQEIS